MLWPLWTGHVRGIFKEKDLGTNQKNRKHTDAIKIEKDRYTNEIWPKKSRKLDYELIQRIKICKTVNYIILHRTVCQPDRYEKNLDGLSSEGTGFGNMLAVKWRNHTAVRNQPKSFWWFSFLTSPTRGQFYLSCALSCVSKILQVEASKLDLQCLRCFSTLLIFEETIVKLSTLGMYLPYSLPTRNDVAGMWEIHPLSLSGINLVAF